MKYSIVLCLLVSMLMADPTQVLFVVTSADQMVKDDGSIMPTGCWAEEYLEPLVALENAGYAVTVVSPKGGKIPFDPSSLNPQAVGELAGKYQELLSQKPHYQCSLPIKNVLQFSQFPYELVYLAGGHGTVVDFYNNGDIKELLTKAVQNRKILAGVCHGVIGLLNLGDQKLLLGASVTGFSAANEEAIGLTATVNTYLHDSVQNHLAKMVGPYGQYTCAKAWESHVVNYQNRLITGQAPTSVAELVHEILRVLASLSQNPVKANIQKNYPVYGSFVTIGHPSVAEALSLTGVDFLWIEGEHAALSLPDILSLNIAAEQNKVASIVRVPSNNFDIIKQYVDTGAMGIIVPNIKNAQEAQMAVRALKYPPEGERGMGLGRATRYFIKLQEYLPRANKDVMAILMVEHKDAVANVEDIVKVSGIDLLCIGPFDLSASFGIPGQIQHPLVQNAIQRVERIALKAGIPLGISVPDQTTAETLLQRGYRFFVIGADVEYLYQGPKRFFATPKNNLGWQINNNMKYSYAYLPSCQGKNVSSWITPKSINLFPAYKPDISNIALDGIHGLGFPLPNVPDSKEYNLYLKLYKYPTELNTKISAERNTNAYFPSNLLGADVIRKYVEHHDNVVIKHAVIGKTNYPYQENDCFPALKIPTTCCNISGQVIFDSNVPFMTLCLQPSTAKPLNASPDMQAQWSTQGLIAFYPQLVTAYRQNMIETSGPDANSYYFIQLNYSTHNSQFSVFRVPKSPMIFSNFKNLPMPHDPSKIFLTGLLLVYKTEYASTKTISELLSEKAWYEHAMSTSAQVMEISSVVELD